MRQPPDGSSGTSDSTGEIACETRSQAALPQRSEETPPATVARKTPRPMRLGKSGDVSLICALHVGHAGEELAAQVPGVALRVHPDGVGSRLRLDQAQRLRRDRAAVLRGVAGAEPRDYHAGRIAD